MANAMLSTFVLEIWQTILLNLTKLPFDCIDFGSITLKGIYDSKNIPFRGDSKQNKMVVNEV